MASFDTHSGMAGTTVRLAASTFALQASRQKPLGLLVPLLHLVDAIAARRSRATLAECQRLALNERTHVGGGNHLAATGVEVEQEDPSSSTRPTCATAQLSPGGVWISTPSQRAGVRSYRATGSRVLTNGSARALLILIWRGRTLSCTHACEACIPVCSSMSMSPRSRCLPFAAAAAATSTPEASCTVVVSRSAEEAFFRPSAREPCTCPLLPWRRSLGRAAGTIALTRGRADISPAHSLVKPPHRARQLRPSARLLRVRAATRCSRMPPLRCTPRRWVSRHPVELPYAPSTRAGGACRSPGGVPASRPPECHHAPTRR